MGTKKQMKHNWIWKLIFGLRCKGFGHGSWLFQKYAKAVKIFKYLHFPVSVERNICILASHTYMHALKIHFCWIKVPTEKFLHLELPCPGEKWNQLCFFSAAFSNPLLVVKRCCTTDQDIPRLMLLQKLLKMFAKNMA